MDVVAAGSTLTRLYNASQLGRIRVELSADALEPGSGTFVLPDPDSDDAISGGRQFRIDEGTTLISDGFVGVQTRERGPNPVHPAVEATYTIWDANALVHGKRMVGWSRPAETDQDRIIARAAIDLPGVDTSMVLGTNLATMEAKNYTTVGWDELIRDVFEYTGKTLFLHDKADGSGRCLHSHKETEGHTSGLEITDDLTVADGVTKFLARMSPNRNRSSQQLENDVYARDQAGRTATAADAGSIADHDADGLYHQAIVDFTASSQADLQAKADAYIVEQADEIDIYSCIIGPLDEDALALIRPGDRIDVDSQTLDFTGTIRIAHMSLTPRLVAGIVQWDADLELGQAIRLRRRIPSGVKPIPVGAVVVDGRAIAGELLLVEHFSEADYAIITSREEIGSGGGIWDPGPGGGGIEQVIGARSWDVTGMTGNNLARTFIRHEAPVGAVMARLRASVYLTQTEGDDVEMKPVIYRGIMPSGPWEWPGNPGNFEEINPFFVWTRTLDAAFTPDRSGPFPFECIIPVIDGNVAFVFGDRGHTDSPIDNGWIAYMQAQYEDIGDPDKYELTFYGPAGAGAIGAEVLPTSIANGDGAETIFQTPYPYQPGTLAVYVEGILQEADETSPGSGEFTLSYAPPVGYHITARFVIASTDQTGVPIDPPDRELGPLPGSDIRDVASANAPGASRKYASEDHAHEGVHSLAGLEGDVTFTAGTNITITPTGNDLEIASTGGGGGSGGWDTFGADGVQLEAGRSYIYDQANDANITLDGEIILTSGAGTNITLITDTGAIVEMDSDGVRLPNSTSDPSSPPEGLLLFRSDTTFLRLFRNGQWVNLPWMGTSGAATITSGNTSVVVTHGNAFDPVDARGVSVWPTNNPTNDPGWFWVSAVGATTFTINVRANPGASGASFAWRIVPR